MTTTDFSQKLGTLDQALGYLRIEKTISFEAFAAIMQFHILEVPDLGSLRQNFDRREWPHLSGQLRSFASMRMEVLLNSVLSQAGPGELRHQGLIIQLMRELSAAAGSMGQGAPEMGH